MGDSFQTATDTLAALKARKVSSVELVDDAVRRIERLDPPINAVVVRDFQRARDLARASDAERSSGRARGALHGLPMTVKECFDVAGLPTTSGDPALRSNIPQRHADAVGKLVDAGAIIIGKTNVPLYAGDQQSYNSVYGTTNNPWNREHTCGGSSGGSAAALAMGFTPLELGSDIGGSIRNPAHYCGVYGHKPSYGVVSLRGHVPGPPGSIGEADIAVAGPLARSAADLDLAVSVIAGPREWDSVAWRLDLPKPRPDRLAAFRVAVCADHAFCPVDNEIAKAIHSVADRLCGAGTKVQEATPDFDFVDAFRVYYRLLANAMSAGIAAKDFASMLQHASQAAADDHSLATVFVRGATARHADHLRDVAQRQRQRSIWNAFFRDWDIFLCPVVNVAAFQHDHRPFHERTLSVNGHPRPYFEGIGWAGVIGNARLPSTSVPIGRTRDGLPIGMQVVAPYLQDRTAIAFAGHLADLVGGLVAPAGI